MGRRGRRLNTVSVKLNWVGQGLDHRNAAPTPSIEIASFSGLREMVIFPTRKPVPSVGKMQSNIGEQEVLVEVNQPVTYVRGAETLAPPATDQQDFPDWSVLRRNNVRQFPHTNYPNYGYPG